MSGIELAPYQLEYLADRSPRKHVCKARRVGFSFVCALEAACDAAGIDLIDGKYDPAEGIDYRVVSSGQALARDLLQVVAMHLDRLEDELGVRIVEKRGVLRDRIELTNGRRIEAYAANPRRMRAGKGGVLWDETASTPYQDDCWQALKPSVDPHIGRPQGYPLRCVSTPLGDSNTFGKIGLERMGDSFRRYRVTIEDARSQGFPAPSIEELRDLMPDPLRYGQEYMCDYLASSSRLVSEQAYDACTYDLDEWPGADTNATASFAGFDPARSARGDNAAAVEVHAFGGDVLWVVPAGAEVQRGVPFDELEAWATGLIDRTSRFALDATGLSMDLGERLERAHGARVEAVSFSLGTKGAIAAELSGRFYRRALRVPADDTDLRRAVLSLERHVTPAGNERIVAPRTVEHGHADAAWALGLACWAARDEGQLDPGEFGRVRHLPRPGISGELRRHRPLPTAQHQIGERRRAAIERNRVSPRNRWRR